MEEEPLSLQIWVKKELSQLDLLEARHLVARLDPSLKEGRKQIVVCMERTKTEEGEPFTMTYEKLRQEYKFYKHIKVKDDKIL